ISRAGVLAAVLLIGVSWVGPTFSRYETLAQIWGAITSPFQSAQDWIGDALGTLRGPLAVIPEYYGDELTLEAGVQPEDLSIMDVDPQRLPTGSGRFYWRSKVYDHYADGSWTSTASSSAQFDPGEGDLSLPHYDGREVIEVTVTPRIGALVSLYLPSQPIWVNRSAEVIGTIVEEELVDIASLTASQAVMRGEPYRARASVASPNGLQLRWSGSEYPDWVLERYLQISDSITPRTLELARRITEGHDTPYDKAVAITAWLRRNIEYSRVTRAPPQDMEPLDWFLFDYRIGFCNYYASAQVVMLRAVGVPSRLAAGYARGEYDTNIEIYNVTAEDSHSWPEVYFPGFGWVEFEPTVSQDPLSRPEPLTDEELGESEGSGEDDLGGTDNLERLEDLLYPEEGGPDLLEPAQRSVLGRVLVAIAASLILVILWMRLDPAAWAAAGRMIARGLIRLGVQPPPALLTSQDEATLTGRIYHRWNIWLRRLGAPLHAAQTPFERASAFAILLPSSAAEGWTIVNAYAQERYGRISVDEDDVRQAWRRLSPQILLAWLWRTTERFRESQEAS
nr:DUF4129 domain-containing protein [Anaerolineales bacterium]